MCRGVRAVETAFPQGMSVRMMNTCLAGESGPAIMLLDVLTGTADSLIGGVFVLIRWFAFSYSFGLRTRVRFRYAICVQWNLL